MFCVFPIFLQQACGKLVIRKEKKNLKCNVYEAYVGTHEKKGTYEIPVSGIYGADVIK